jgi:NADH-quinone oxidoreductase subunit L
MVFLTFHGDPRTEQARQPHGVRWNVKGPLVVLGVLATVAGFVNMVPVAKLTGLHIEFLHDWLAHGELSALTAEHYSELLHDYAGYTAESLSPILPGLLSLGLALAGVGVAYKLYNVRQPRAHVERLGGVKTVLFNNYYQDEYQVWLARDVTVPIARVADTFDQGIIDGVVNATSSVSLFAGRRLRRVQSGVVTNYAALLTLAFIVLLLAVGFAGGWL